METVMLQAGGGAAFVGHIAMPEGAPRGCIVVLHEAFGVTPHIERVCEDFADHGYAVIAPAMLALAVGKPEGVVLGQHKEGLDEARRLINLTNPDDLSALVDACVQWGRGLGLKVGVVGYCWGGSVAYTAASHLTLDAAVCYYGGMIQDICTSMQPKCPTLVHLAKLDRYIPVEEATGALKAYDTTSEVHVYEADHGFNRDDGVTWNPGAALVARRLTLDLFLKFVN